MDGAYDADEIVLICVAARKTRTMRCTSCFLSGRTSSLPGTAVPRSSTDSLTVSGRHPIDAFVPSRHSPQRIN
jgi:hypothetical protein